MKKTTKERLKAWKDGDDCYFIEVGGTVIRGKYYIDIPAWEMVKNYTGLFRTKAEAEARLEAIKNFIKNL